MEYLETQVAEPFQAYIDNQAPNELVIRRVRAFLSQNNITVNDIQTEAIKTDKWVDYLPALPDKKLFGLYRKWLTLLNQLPKVRWVQ